MEYFVGSALTMVAVYVSFKMMQRRIPERVLRRSVHSQSYFYDVIKVTLPIMEMLQPRRKRVSQSTKEQAKHTLRILVVDNEAYWIKNHAVYSSQIIDGILDEESTKVVDIMGMDKVELDKMVFIIDKLTEGTQE
jgi:hypothetical protein